jgi:hypothetical protein
MDDDLTRPPSLKWTRENLLDQCSRRGSEIKRLRKVTAGDGARIYALQARVIALEEIEERARLQAAHALQDEDRNLARIILGELDWDI